MLCLLLFLRRPRCVRVFCGLLGMDFECERKHCGKYCNCWMACYANKELNPIYARWKAISSSVGGWVPLPCCVCDGWRMHAFPPAAAAAPKSIILGFLRIRKHDCFQFVRVNLDISPNQHLLPRPVPDKRSLLNVVVLLYARTRRSISKYGSLYLCLRRSSRRTG